jgi:Protein of unknown function (DUF3386)
MTAQQPARELFRAAYENRYTWDRAFPGYTADVKLQQGDEIFVGTIQVNPNLSAEVMGIEDKAASDSIQGQLREVAIHRIRRTFDETHAKNEFSYGDAAADGAVEILVGGKSSGDKYKVADDKVTLVHRHIHGIVVTINTLSTHDTGEGYLSHRYDSVYADPATGEQKGGLTVFEDNYTKVGDYHLISQRILESVEDGQPTVTKFEFSNFHLLPVPVPTTAMAA